VTNIGWIETSALRSTENFRPFLSREGHQFYVYIRRKFVNPPSRFTTSVIFVRHKILASGNLRNSTRVFISANSSTVVYLFNLKVLV